MTLEAVDRLHAKQGRSTARVVFPPAAEATDRAVMTRDTSTSADRAVMTGNTGTSALPPGPLTVYLNRHFRLPWLARLAALVDPAGRHSPGAAEWSHLQRARSLGVPVPEVVAAGERIGPWANLQSYLMVAELTGSLELNVALPELAAELGPLELACAQATPGSRSGTHHRGAAPGLRLPQRPVPVPFLPRPPAACRQREGSKTGAIDLHRLAEHRLWPDRWRCKDLGQLLYSTVGVAGIDDRDILRFWKHYRLALNCWPRWQARGAAEGSTISEAQSQGSMSRPEGNGAA